MIREFSSKIYCLRRQTHPRKQIKVTQLFPPDISQYSLTVVTLSLSKIMIQYMCRTFQLHLGPSLHSQNLVLKSHWNAVQESTMFLVTSNLSVTSPHQIRNSKPWLSLFPPSFDTLITLDRIFQHYGSFLYIQ